MNQNTTQTEKTDVNNQNQVDPNATLNVQDLQNLLAIVDFAAQNGLYRGWDTILAVHVLREKLFNFLKSIDPNFDPNKTTQNQTEATLNQSQQQEERKVSAKRTKK